MQLTKENKGFIGIDVGSKGFIAIQDENGCFDFKSINKSTIKELSEFLKQQKTKFNKLVCVIEDVHAIFGSSAKSMFSFGMNKGMLLALLESDSIPYHLVQPKAWQKEMWDNHDMVVALKQAQKKVKNKITNKTEVVSYWKKKVDTKETSYKAASRIFPNLDFRATIRCKKYDDNKVDATLMSEYARRKNL